MVGKYSVVGDCNLVWKYSVVGKYSFVWKYSVVGKYSFVGKCSFVWKYSFSVTDVSKFSLVHILPCVIPAPSDTPM